METRLVEREGGVLESLSLASGQWETHQQSAHRECFAFDHVLQAIRRQGTLQLVLVNALLVLRQLPATMQVQRADRFGVHSL